MIIRIVSKLRLPEQGRDLEKEKKGGLRTQPSQQASLCTAPRSQWCTCHHIVERQSQYPPSTASAPDALHPTPPPDGDAAHYAAPPSLPVKLKVRRRHAHPRTRAHARANVFPPTSAIHRRFARVQYGEGTLKYLPFTVLGSRGFPMPLQLQP